MPQAGRNRWNAQEDDLVAFLISLKPKDEDIGF
jgi:hypothetical protein